MCAREHAPVSRFKWHTLKLLKPDEKLHPKLFPTSILLMRGDTENRTSHLVGKEKWKLKKVVSACDLMRCWEATRSWWNTSAMSGRRAGLCFHKDALQEAGGKTAGRESAIPNNLTRFCFWHCILTCCYSPTFPLGAGKCEGALLGWHAIAFPKGSKEKQIGDAKHARQDTEIDVYKR